MRNLMIAAATASILLAGCSGMDNRTGSGTSGSSSAPSASTSGNSTTVVPPAGPAGATAREGGLDSRTISPNEPGLGQSPTRESLTNPNRAGSGSSSASPYPRTQQGQMQNQTISPNEPGMGQSQTRRSLPNGAGTQ
ncbi:hypothetical protein [Azospirillum rugosum]|uniref:Lipoprotein n=1 Tax=Azospirillum rugosum TaxID=416170 RepID=A0ABS4SHE6_9PROT|nr:hypothetical protein [Azospirillum rugosum]MBP2291991.1 hypothetical protein [Azospirillum rugosum]MDQ0525873.1 hypothetical protein [Azospirillum rugosum]